MYVRACVQSWRKKIIQIIFARGNRKTRKEKRFIVSNWKKNVVNMIQNWEFNKIGHAIVSFAHHNHTSSVTRSCHAKKTRSWSIITMNWFWIHSKRRASSSYKPILPLNAFTSLHRKKKIFLCHNCFFYTSFQKCALAHKKIHCDADGGGGPGSGGSD